MTFQGAVIREQGVTFAVVIVRTHVIDSSAEANRAIAAFQPVFPSLPVVLMAQDHQGTPTYYGRKDIARFLADVPLEAIPWRNTRSDRAARPQHNRGRGQMMEGNMQVCIYCQTNPKETNDHVPPKGLFREPRPSNLITVPACLKCNNGFSGDDDYFLNLALDWAASESTEGKGVVEKRLRSMKRKEGRNVWKPFFAKVKPVEVYSPGGVYMANSFEFTLDTSRLIRTVNRMIRGLYFEFTKTPLPMGDYTRSMLFSHYVEQHKDQSEAMEFVQHIPQLPGRIVGQDTFEVRYAILDPALHSSFWYLEFYRRFAFVGTTGAAAAPSEVRTATYGESQEEAS